jgi:hypothetical protein
MQLIQTFHVSCLVASPNIPSNSTAISLILETYFADLYITEMFIMYPFIDEDMVSVLGQKNMY